MDDTETCNVSGTLATVLRVSSAFGLAPLRFSPLRNSTLPLRAPSLRPQQNRPPGHFGYSMSLSRKHTILGRIFLLTIVTSQGMWCIPFINLHMSYIVLVYIATFIKTTIVMVVIALDGKNKMKRFISYLNKIEEMHDELGSSYLNLKIKKSSIIFWGFISIPIVHCGWLTFFELQTNKSIAIKSIAICLMAGFYIAHIIEILVVMQFAFIVCSLNATLCVLNERLRSLVYNLKIYDSMKIRTATNAHITLRRLCRTYMSIRELVRSIDTGEGTLVFILLVACTLDIMGNIIFILSSYKSTDKWSYVVVIQFSAMVWWGLYKLASLTFLVEPCHRTRQGFQEVQNLVSDLMCASYEREFRHELSRYHDQVVHNIPAFTPLGICVLTRQFIVTVIGCIATFLTIALQFRIKDDIDLTS